MKALIIAFLLLALRCAADTAPSISPPQPGANVPSAVIESVLDDGRAENLGAFSESSRSITVPHRFRHLEIRYSATNLASPDQARFRVRLQGFDNNWVNAGSLRSVMYPPLPPGSYRFEVNVADTNGIWNEGGNTLNITVEREGLRFQATMAALFLLVFILGFVFLTFWRKRHGQSGVG